jgi:hypothetical protein
MSVHRILPQKHFHVAALIAAMIVVITTMLAISLSMPKPAMAQTPTPTATASYWMECGSEDTFSGAYPYCTWGTTGGAFWENCPWNQRPGYISYTSDMRGVVAYLSNVTWNGDVDTRVASGPYGPAFCTDTGDDPCYLARPVGCDDTDSAACVALGFTRNEWWPGPSDGGWIYNGGWEQGGSSGSWTSKRLFKKSVLSWVS